MLDDADRRALLNDYCTASPQGAAIREAFPYAAVQRLAQALGAFGRLSANPATGRFVQHIPPATAMLNAMMTQLPAIHARLQHPLPTGGRASPRAAHG